MLACIHSVLAYIHRKQPHLHPSGKNTPTAHNAITLFERLFVVNPPGSLPVRPPTSPATTRMRPAYHADSNTGVVSQRLTSGAVASRLCWHCWCSSSCRRCGGCAQATYCSAGCRRDDWPRHREWCTFDTVRLLRRRLPDLVVLQILHHANIRVPRHMRLRIGDSHPARLGVDGGAMPRTVNASIPGGA